MPVNRELRKVACPGCGAIFQTHSKAIVYCCQSCAYYSPALHSYRQPVCFGCDTWMPITRPTGELLTPEEHQKARAEFELEHQNCMRAWLDSVKGEERLACRCMSCRRQRGNVPSPGDLGRAPRVRERKSSPTYVRNRSLVFERDGWICRICGLPLDREASITDDLYPQVDHMVAVAWGGDDELDNLRAAHRWCNGALSIWGNDDLVRDAALFRYASRNPPVVPQRPRTPQQQE